MFCISGSLRAFRFNMRGGIIKNGNNLLSAVCQTALIKSSFIHPLNNCFPVLFWSFPPKNSVLPINWENTKTNLTL